MRSIGYYRKIQRYRHSLMCWRKKSKRCWVLDRRRYCRGVVPLGTCHESGRSARLLRVGTRSLWDIFIPLSLLLVTPYLYSYLTILDPVLLIGVVWYFDSSRVVCLPRTYKFQCLATSCVYCILLWCFLSFLYWRRALFCISGTVCICCYVICFWMNVWDGALSVLAIKITFFLSFLFDASMVLFSVASSLFWFG